jgi:putative phosphoesterase
LRIVVISDIHSNIDSFRTVIAELPPYDSILFLGDLIGYGPNPNEVVEQLQQLKPAAALMGNHDHAVTTGDVTGFSPLAAVAIEWTRRCIKPKNLAYLSSLQSSARIRMGNVELALFHGSPADPLSEYIFPGISNDLAKRVIHSAGVSLVLLGHTHMPMVYSFGEEMLANPGSVGQPRDGDPRAAFAVLTISEGKFSFEIKRVQYEMTVVAERIVRAGLPEFLGERLYAGI